MQDTYTPIVFQRHNRPLRAVMIDNQPWFACRDLLHVMMVPDNEPISRYFSV